MRTVVYLGSFDPLTKGHLVKEIARFGGDVSAFVPKEEKVALDTKLGRVLH